MTVIELVEIGPDGSMVGQHQAKVFYTGSELGVLIAGGVALAANLNAAAVLTGNAASLEAVEATT